MKWRALWRGAKALSEDNMATLGRTAPTERLGWDAVLWPVVLVVGASIVGTYCR